MTTTATRAHHWSGGRLLAGRPVILRADDGSHQRPPIERWLGPVTTEERAVMQRALGPVLDVGCGPGRHVAAFTRAGVPALGIDVAPEALAIARQRGAPVMRASVFDALPHEGRWGTALLFDGSIGIGGAPSRLLLRLSELLRPGGRVLVELERPASGLTRTMVCVHAPDTNEEPDPAWFPWARVPVDAIERVAATARLVPHETWEEAGRWFARLDKR